MTTVKYDPQKFLLTVDGHSGYAESGDDIVCASVSILCYTLAFNLTAEESKGSIKGLITEFDNGHVSIRCKPIRCMENHIKRIYEYFIAGFNLLEVNYAGYVTVIK